MDIARLLLDLDVDSAEIIDTEYQRVEDRRADLVARMRGRDGAFTLHVEIQNDNQKAMPWRMLRYRVDIGQSYPDTDIRQYVIYIGKPDLTMPSGLTQTGLVSLSDYRHAPVDGEVLLAHDDPDALVLAILCDFKGRPERDVVRYILTRLKQLTDDREGWFREYVHMLEVLSSNRNLEHVIE